MFSSVWKNSSDAKVPLTNESAEQAISEIRATSKEARLAIANNFLELPDGEVLDHFVRGCFAYAAAIPCWKVWGMLGGSFIEEDLDTLGTCYSLLRFALLRCV
jgi:hypothetical protein